MFRSLLLVFCLIQSSSSVFSQITVNEFYDDPENLLLFSSVYEVDSTPRSEFSKRIKNWTGTNFVNSREVIVSETEDQMVLVYSMNKFFVKVLGMRNYLPWYIRLVVQIKDNKIRCLFYDDGNVFRPGSYYNGISVPSVPARQNRFHDYMKKGVSPKNQVDAFIEVREYIINTGQEIFEAVKRSSTSDPKNLSNDDW